jgi:hypothetical protein
MLSDSKVIADFYRLAPSHDFRWRVSRLCQSLMVFCKPGQLTARILPPLNRGAAPSCQILLIERLAYQRLDYRLSTDVQLFGGPVQFFQHARRQVNIHPLYRTHHAPVIGEEP